MIFGGCDFIVLSGDDSMMFFLFFVGGEGVILVVGNIVFSDMLKMFVVFEEGWYDDVWVWYCKFF